MHVFSQLNPATYPPGGGTLRQELRHRTEAFCASQHKVEGLAGRGGRCRPPARKQNGKAKRREQCSRTRARALKAEVVQVSARQWILTLAKEFVAAAAVGACATQFVVATRLLPRVQISSNQPEYQFHSNFSITRLSHGKIKFLPFIIPWRLAPGPMGTILELVATRRSGKEGSEGREELSNKG